MARKDRELFIEGMNYYVPGMQAGADLGQRLMQRLSLGRPVDAESDGIVDGADPTGTGLDLNVTDFESTYDPDVMGPFGRNLTVVLGGSGTVAVTIIGRDYLGQPMRETRNTNGTTPVVFLKAFKYVDRILVAAVGEDIDIGWGERFGLPYKTVAVEREYANGVAVTAGTLVTPVLTDPQTAATGDPRGTYEPETTPNGSILIEADVQYSHAVNDDGNGGLHGIRHFNG